MSQQSAWVVYPLRGEINSVKKKGLENLVCAYVSYLLYRAIQWVTSLGAVLFRADKSISFLRSMFHRVEQDTHSPTKNLLNIVSLERTVCSWSIRCVCAVRNTKIRWLWITCEYIKLMNHHSGTYKWALSSLSFLRIVLLQQSTKDESAIHTSRRSTDKK
jgi:uncharacterized protein YsxB (DUF464 family)